VARVRFCWIVRKAALGWDFRFINKTRWLVLLWRLGGVFVFVCLPSCLFVCCVLLLLCIIPVRTSTVSTARTLNHCLSLCCCCVETLVGVAYSWEQILGVLLALPASCLSVLVSSQRPTTTSHSHNYFNNSNDALVLVLAILKVLYCLYNHYDLLLVFLLLRVVIALCLLSHSNRSLSLSHSRVFGFCRYSVVLRELPPIIAHTL
jgi:hypothetical protein